MNLNQRSSGNTAPKYKTLKITYSNNKLHILWSLVFFAIWAALIFLVWLHLKNLLPNANTIENEANHSNEFIAERAERRLQDLVRIGPRVTGSANNEQSAVKFLLDSVDSIKTYISRNHQIEVDRQIASGFKFPTAYQNIQNVIVKLSPIKQTSNSTILINSHFDTVTVSPGAGDDGSMVAVMLEVLRVLAQSHEELKHSIIFLFNGAEEIDLLGAHAFVTQHRWAKNVKSFINLDSIGIGGREILFRTTSSPASSHPWLIQCYKNSVKHPFAAILAQEIFDWKILPFDTDFTVFQTLNEIPGLDFAYIHNGYVYHSEHDALHSVSRESLQNTGDNILALARAIDNADELENPKDHIGGKMIFYDYLGLFLINYTITESIFINVIVTLVAVLVIMLSFYLMKRNSGLFYKRIFMRFSVILLIQILTILLSLTLVILMAYFLDAIKSPMSWYTKNWLIFGLYFCLIFFGLSLLPLIYIKLTEENEFFPLNYKIQMFMHSHCFIFVIILLLSTIMNISSGYLFMMSVFFYTISVILNLVTKFQEKSISWIIFPIICQIVPFLYYVYIIFTMFMVFIPITGRNSIGSNPEINIGIISFIFALLIAGFLIPLLFIFSKPESLVTLFGIIVVTFVILAVTPFGFPYCNSTFQTFEVHHTSRIIHDRNNNVVFQQYGYIVRPWDRKSTDTIIDALNNVSLPISIKKTCFSDEMCGLPFRPRTTDLYMPAETPILIRTPILRTITRRLVYNERDQPKIIRHEYNLSGPDRMTIEVKTHENCKLVGSSITPVDNAKTLTIRYANGISSENATLSFWLDFQRTNLEGPCFDISVSSYLLHHAIYRTDEFRNFLKVFPKWTSLVPLISSFEGFTV